MKKKLATWLGIAALALQMALPLAATAAVASAESMPICSAAGTPRQLPAQHCDHCPLCFAATHASPPLHRPSLPIPEGADAALPGLPIPVLPSRARRSADARAPPLPPSVAFDPTRTERKDEKALIALRLYAARGMAAR